MFKIQLHIVKGMWTQIYQPKNFIEFIGKKAAEELQLWKGGKLMITGPTGVGKSVAASLLADFGDYDLQYITNENLEHADAIAATQSLFGGKKLLVLEDIESFKDIKGVGVLLKNIQCDIILTCGDPTDKRVATVKKLCQIIQLRRPLPTSIANHLQSICEMEGLTYEKEVLTAIAKNASGDIRAALIDAHAMAAYPGLDGVPEEKLIPKRDVTGDIYKALSVIFGGRDFNKIVKSTWELNEQPKDILWWVDENTPRLYKDHKSVYGCLKNLSKADVYLGRIMRRQYWGYLRYANVLMTAGVNVNRPEKINFTQYMFPQYFANMGKTKFQRNIEEGIAKKMGPILHVSKKVVKEQYINLLKDLIKSESQTETLSTVFGLTDDEINYLSA